MLFKCVILLLGVSMVAGVDDLSHLCDGLAGIDCATQYLPGEDDEQVCGSDGITYVNFCFYSKARCANRNMVMVQTGMCPSLTTTDASITASTASSSSSASAVSTPAVTGVSASTVVMTTKMRTTTMGPTTQDPLLVAFCQSKNSITCGQNLDPICGSDKKFYLNQCEFSKAYCDNTSLVSKDIAFCTGK